jgi:hypothetical protein
MKNYSWFLCVTMGGNINVDFIKHTIVDMLTSKWNSHSIAKILFFMEHQYIRGFCGSWKLRNIIHNEIQNVYIIILCQVRNPKIKDPMNQEFFLKPRKFAIMNENIFTVSGIWMQYCPEISILVKLINDSIHPFYIVIEKTSQLNFHLSQTHKLLQYFH